MRTEVVAKGCIKHEVVAKASELSINICRESLYVINVAFGYEKNNPARRAGEKNNLAPILSEKNFSARTKIPSPLPEYQMDCA